MLALGSIYEKGLADEKTCDQLTIGAIQRKQVPENTTKAFEFYDKAAEFEPYALFKLGQFMETGKYEEGYKGIKNF
jgi:TPR repeat protein